MRIVKTKNAGPCTPAAIIKLIPEEEEEEGRSERERKNVHRKYVGGRRGESERLCRANQSSACLMYFVSKLAGL